MTKFGMVTHMGRGVFLGGQPRHCIFINASRDLSAIAGFFCRKRSREYTKAAVRRFEHLL